jgi:hypothetical protein
MTIEEMKIYCKENNEKLYRIVYPWGINLCFGKPIYNEKLNIIEFVDIETKKEWIIKIGINDKFTIAEQ